MTAVPRRQLSKRSASYGVAGTREPRSTVILKGRVSCLPIVAPDSLLSALADSHRNALVHLAAGSPGDTILLDQDSYALIATKRLDGTMTTTVLEHIQRANIYTIRTGRPLTIRAVFGLETAGAGATRRMVAYRRDPGVVKMHIPMPLRWLQAEQRLLKFEVPGIFRVGGVEVRRKDAMRYVDGI